ncbi:phosphatidylinositol transfer protein 3-like [Hydra vulgaris]|uniref:phosphatidylinositol transfer protein 3-like n=1 Tax=Hydra vulgaris TaxID=6087 RepID=UPI0032EA1869
MAGNVLDSKYNIQRPQADPRDVDILYQLVQDEIKVQKDWNEAWINRRVLTQFLQANVTVEESFKVFKQFCNWRFQYKVDQIDRYDPEIMAEHSIGRVKFSDIRDVAGRPVAYVYPRYHNKYHGNEESLNKYIIYCLEELCKLSNQFEEGDGKFSFIIDLDGFSLQNMDYPSVKKMVWFLKNCYPERLGVCLFINYPWIFYSCWAIIKCFLNDVTRSKFFFCGKDEYREFIGLEMS